MGARRTISTRRSLSILPARPRLPPATTQRPTQRPPSLSTLHHPSAPCPVPAFRSPAGARSRRAGRPSPSASPLLRSRTLRSGRACRSSAAARARPRASRPPAGPVRLSCCCARVAMLTEGHRGAHRQDRVAAAQPRRQPVVAPRPAFQHRRPASALEVSVCMRPHALQ
jgi:hypothetical protein